MHASLKEIAPCLLVCGLVERVLAKSLIQPPPTELVLGEPEDLRFSWKQPVYDGFQLRHEIQRGNRVIVYGIDVPLDGSGEPDPDVVQTYFFIAFFENDGLVYEFLYDPVTEEWCFGDDEDPNNQFLEEETIDTTEALSFITTYTRWFVDMNADLPCA